MTVMQLNSVEDTTLWQRLKNGFDKEPDAEVASELATIIKSICQEAYDRMKGFPSLHGQYTLHDATHLLRVTEMMSKIIPEEVFNELNPVEVALLILAAHLHDQGMVLEAHELEALNSNPEFQIFRSNWVIDHPNLKETQQHLNDQNLSGSERAKYRYIEQQLLDSMLTDYIRQTHGKRSATFIRKTYSDDRRLEVVGTNLAELIAKLSISHVQDAHGLTPTNGFYFDESVGTYKVNMVYLGLILRLADILDLDRDRTPNVLYKTIGFTSKVSLAEWEKHRSVDGWDISPTNIRFTMRSEHPVYQKSALQFMDWIDGELSDAHDITRNFPGEFERYKLELPLKVDRSRIKPKNDAYIFHDLQFALSRNEIINLLMTTELYGDTSLAVREMLQNSLDALRYRQALIKVSGHDWNQGKIQLEHFVNQEGHEVVRCTDNGVGMSEDIITRFLTNAGRSYYRSPEFEQERIRFREAGVDFDPCSQFGIGFMSYFMLGDTITLHTRRDYGPERGLGKPLIVEINGLSSIVVIRKGSQEQLAGTAIEIVGRKKPRFLDEYEDKVKLIEVVNGYALATEYPIEAKCSVSELENSLDIPPTIKVRKTQIEEVGLLNQVTFEQDFADIDPRLSGKVRTSFLTDEQGNFTLENYEAAWVKDEHDNSALLVNGKKIEYDFYKNGQTCEDGILVCGEPGRYQRTRTLANWANQINLGNDYFVLNVQGAIKPKLTPARTPPRDHFGEKTASWRNLQRLASQAHGRLWEKIASRIGHNLDSELFWQLCEIYKASVHNLRSETIYNNLKVPVFGSDGKYEWRSISSLQT